MLHFIKCLPIIGAVETTAEYYFQCSHTVLIPFQKQCA